MALIMIIVSEEDMTRGITLNNNIINDNFNINKYSNKNKNRNTNKSTATSHPPKSITIIYHNILIIKFHKI